MPKVFGRRWLVFVSPARQFICPFLLGPRVALCCRRCFFFACRAVGTAGNVGLPVRRSGRHVKVACPPKRPAVVGAACPSKRPAGVGVWMPVRRNGRQCLVLLFFWRMALCTCLIHYLLSVSSGADSGFVLQKLLCFVCQAVGTAGNGFVYSPLWGRRWLCVAEGFALCARPSERPAMSVSVSPFWGRRWLCVQKVFLAAGGLSSFGLFA